MSYSIRPHVRGQRVLIIVQETEQNHVWKHNHRASASLQLFPELF
jgi:hypothetical protein